MPVLVGCSVATRADENNRFAGTLPYNSRGVSPHEELSDRGTNAFQLFLLKYRSTSFPLASLLRSGVWVPGSAFRQRVERGGTRHGTTQQGCSSFLEPVSGRPVGRNERANGGSANGPTRSFQGTEAATSSRCQGPEQKPPGALSMSRSNSAREAKRPGEGAGRKWSNDLKRRNDAKVECDGTSGERKRSWEAREASD